MDFPSLLTCSFSFGLECDEQNVSAISSSDATDGAEADWNEDVDLLIIFDAHAEAGDDVQVVNWCCDCSNEETNKRVRS